MSDTKIFDSVRIIFRESHPQEMRMAAFLRSQKEIGKELKAEVLKPLYSFLDTFAVGSDSKSTPAEIETAFITSMIAMSSQMSSLALYCRLEHGINLSPESWRTFGLLPSPIGTSLHVLPSITTTESPTDLRETTGQRLSRENRERLEEINQQAPSVASVVDSEVLIETLPIVDNRTAITRTPPPVPDEIDDDGDDDETDEEYLARTAHLVINRSSKIVE